jgi:hypothetical protein
VLFITPGGSTGHWQEADLTVNRSFNASFNRNYPLVCTEGVNVGHLYGLVFVVKKAWQDPDFNPGARWVSGFAASGFWPFTHQKVWEAGGMVWVPTYDARAAALDVKGVQAKAAAERAALKPRAALLLGAGGEGGAGESQGSDGDSDGDSADAEGSPESRALSGESGTGAGGRGAQESEEGGSPLDALVWASDIESQLVACAQGRSPESESTEADLLLAIQLSHVDQRTLGKRRGFSEFMNEDRLRQRKEGLAAKQAAAALVLRAKQGTAASKAQAKVDKAAEQAVKAAARTIKRASALVEKQAAAKRRALRKAAKEALALPAPQTVAPPRADECTDLVAIGGTSPDIVPLTVETEIP